MTGWHWLALGVGLTVVGWFVVALVVEQIRSTSGERRDKRHGP